MTRTRIAATLVVMMVAVPDTAFAQGRSAAAQAGTQQGTPFQQLQTQVSALEAQVLAMRQQIQALQAQIGQVESWLQAQLTTINGTLATLQAQIAEGAGATASLAARMTANESAIAALTSAVAALRAQLESTEALIAANAGDLAALQSHAASLQTLIEAHGSQITALQQQTAGLAQFQANLASGSCLTGTAVQDVASSGFVVCTQTGGGALQTLTRTVGTTLFTGTNALSVGCPTGYVATGAGFTVPAVVESQHYVASINPVTLAVSSAVRNVVPITVSHSTTGATSATVQVQYHPLTYYGGYFFQAQVTCARAQP